MMIADLTGRLLRRESLPPPVRSAGLALILLTTATTPAIAQADRRPSASEIAPQVRLMDDVVTLPITMIREYPFVDASIAGVAGKLMLDTGYEPALMVNDHRVPMSGGRSVGIGSFGSGQTFEVRIVPEVSDVRVGDLSFPRVTEVRTQDARLGARHRYDRKALDAHLDRLAGLDSVQEPTVNRADDELARFIADHPNVAGVT